MTFTRNLLYVDVTCRLLSGRVTCWLLPSRHLLSTGRARNLSSVVVTCYRLSGRGVDGLVTTGFKVSRSRARNLLSGRGLTARNLLSVGRAGRGGRGPGARQLPGMETKSSFLVSLIFTTS